MPGGRLTHDDRRRIASALSEGLGYAEIARRLGRPTSTVSREVARNGGPGEYGADPAHRATGRRARRGRTGPHPVEAGRDGGRTDGREPGTVDGFAEQFATTMVHIGLPRMAARVLACLFITESGSLTAAELVRRLQVSPASVSKAIGYLEELALVRREREPGRRRERYVVDDDPWARVWTASARSHATLAETSSQGAAIFPPDRPVGARLARMSRFFGTLSEDMAGGSGAPATEDALTVLAALVHAGVPLGADRLAAALGWAPDRVTAALDDAERHPGIADPVALHRVAPGLFTVVAGPERLTAAQREALGGGNLLKPHRTS
ncbi:MarR family transcriptional regulator [Streptomyces sp. NPDC004609]|uniref:GbsR/MarR family transcriptional regulator n=1 Tax=Streptomyces sp. NPDC004609 TaxID=3364704 RepID=UPI0036C9D021